MFTPEVFDRVPQPVGRCVHVSFYRAGLMKQLPDGGKEVVRKDMPERPTPEQLADLNQKEFFWFDLIDIKAQARFCDHWSSTLRFAPAVLKLHGDSIDNYPNVPQQIKDWFAAGSPLEEKTVDKLHRIGVTGYTFKEVPEATLDYDSCKTCGHYTLDLNADGSPIPFKGKCNKDNLTLKGGVFALGQEQKVHPTYEFLSCHAWLPSSRVNFKDEPVHLPPRLVMFVETNPLEYTPEQLQTMFRLPTITKTRQVAEEEYQAMLAINLPKLVKQRYREVDHSRFATDFKLNPINIYFAKALKRNTAHEAAFWEPFKHYPDSMSLYDQLPAATEADGGHSQASFGNAIAVPANPVMSQPEAS